MNVPSTRLTGLISYLAASPLGRSSAVKQARGGDYHHSKDFYLLLRQAITKDRTTTRDGEALHAAALNVRDHRKKSRFQQLALAWGTQCRRWVDCAPVAVHARSTLVGGLEVVIRPSFAEQRPDGVIEVVIVRFSEPPLTQHLMNAVLRLVQRAYPDMVTTFVAPSQQLVRTTEGRNLERYDTWLETEAAGLAHALRTAA